jgi:hypothetical protein
MVDNFELIKPLLSFDSPDDFYFMQLIQRRKENPEMEKNSRAVKNWLIHSMDQLDKYKPDIISLANHFNARATIRLNKRSYKQCAFESLALLAKNLSIADYTPVDKLYSSVMGSFHADKEKKWLLDADDITIDSPIVAEIAEFIRQLQPVGDKLVAVIPSRSGCHVITRPFNPQTFIKAYPKIEIQKDTPTNIYIP